jgi:hypothetical protein
VADTFVSPEDTVMQNNLTDQQILNNPNTTGTAGSVVPMMTLVPMTVNGTTSNVPGTQSDWRYTWMFTGRQHDYTNGTVFAGDIVVMDSRPIGIDTIISPITNNPSQVASGEIILEAIFGYGSSFTPAPVGYAVAADRIVLLRWPSAMPDPEIKVGSWIADVTYERNQGTSDTRAANAATMAHAGLAPLYPMQRCHWYQVARKGDVQASPTLANFREMVVYTTTPLRSRTLMHNTPAVPVYLNAALFMPSVVNVYSRTVYVR